MTMIEVVSRLDDFAYFKLSTGDLAKVFLKEIEVCSDGTYGVYILNGEWEIFVGFDELVMDINT